ncbi:Transcription factor [Nymphaea thermarum]|nr:Transcription factor [Nymphaea thermarum]
MDRNIVCGSDDINIHDAPLKTFLLASMSAGERLSLKQKLMVELAHVRSAVKNIGSNCLQDLGSLDSCKLLAHAVLPDCAFVSEKCEDNQFVELREKKIRKHSQTASTRSTVTGVKRDPPQGLEHRVANKRPKVDGDMMKQCASLLKKLMSHQFGWVFNHPVDPVKLNIPDYFTIITKPMDLGTVKSKLESKLYLVVQDFASDVRLTFSNAMQYNPPGNDVHLMAKSLNGIFNKKWTTLEEKWRKESQEGTQNRNVKQARKLVEKPRKTARKEPIYYLEPSFKKPMTSADKLKLQKDLTAISRSKLPPELLSFLQKFGSLGPNGDEIVVDIDAFDNDTAWELQKIVKSYLEARSAKSADTGNALRPCGGSTCSIDHKDGDGCLLDEQLSSKACRSLTDCMNGTCSDKTCQGGCGRNDFTQSLSDVDSESSLDRGSVRDRAHGANSLHLDPLSSNANSADKQSGQLDPDTDGAVSALDEENTHSSPNTAAVSVGASGEGGSVTSEMQLSPGKALRAAMLKSRFADTILKAQQKTLLNNGEKRDPVKMRRAREEMERRHQEDKARIEAEVRAAEAAREAEAKRKRDKEREAARLALQNMERTVEINENDNILKDLEQFCYSQGMSSGTEIGSPASGLEGLGVFAVGNPLERLGLFMKNEDLEDDEAPSPDYAAGTGDVEEGEIDC